MEDTSSYSNNLSDKESLERLKKQESIAISVYHGIRIGIALNNIPGMR